MPLSALAVRMSRTGCLLAFALVCLPSWAVERECWELSSVEHSFHRIGSGSKNLSQSTLDRIQFHFSRDFSRQWIEYDNPAYSLGPAHARAFWSPPPSRYCSMDKVPYDFGLTNLRAGDKGQNFANVSWGPDGIYGGKSASGSLYLGLNEEGVTDTREAHLHGGQSSQQSPAAWQARVSIGDLYVSVNYHYRPSDTAAAATVTGQADGPSKPAVSASRQTTASAPAMDVMSEEQQTVLDVFGLPDAFSRIGLPDSEGRLLRHDTWSYFNGLTSYIFVDGNFLRREVFADKGGPVTPSPYSPAQFSLGMSKAQVRAALPDVTLSPIPEAESFLSGYGAEVELLGTSQLLLAFIEDSLVIVEALSLTSQKER